MLTCAVGLVGETNVTMRPMSIASVKPRNPT